MTTNSGDGFTDEQLHEALADSVATEAPTLVVRQSENEALELRQNGRILATLCPAGREPYDYLLVDIMGSPGSDDGPPIRVVARVGELLDLSVLELDSRLEYSPQQWAASRGSRRGPDPARVAEVRHLELDREIEFYERLGIPYTPQEIDVLRDAATHPGSPQTPAQQIRERKKRQPRPSEVNRDLAPAPPPPKWWPFGKKRS